LRRRSDLPHRFLKTLPDPQFASYLIVCYAAISLTVVGVGIVSELAGPTVADAAFGGLIAALGIAALLFELQPSRAAET
jgi:hypothetical protein